MKTTLVLLLLIPSSAWARPAIRCQGPGGRLELTARWEAGIVRRAVLAATPRYGGAFRFAEGTQVSQSWYSMVAAWGDSSVYWPQGARIVLTLTGGRRVASQVIMALDNDANGIFLGTVGRTLNPADLFHRGRQACLLAGFDGDIALRDVVGIEVSRTAAVADSAAVEAP